MGGHAGAASSSGAKTSSSALPTRYRCGDRGNNVDDVKFFPNFQDLPGHFEEPFQCHVKGILTRDACERGSSATALGKECICGDAVVQSGAKPALRHCPLSYLAGVRQSPAQPPSPEPIRLTKGPGKFVRQGGRVLFSDLLQGDDGELTGAYVMVSSEIGAVNHTGPGFLLPPPSPKPSASHNRELPTHRSRDEAGGDRKGGSADRHNGPGARVQNFLCRTLASNAPW